MFTMPQYEIRLHDRSEWKEISEIDLMNSLYKFYEKVTPAIKEMITGKEINTPDGVYRIKWAEESLEYIPEIRNKKFHE